MVRAKFRCEGIKIVKNPEGKFVSADISFWAVTSGSDENKTFWQWTPSGQLNMSCVNENAINQFVEGKEYYLDFTPAN